MSVSLAGGRGWDLEGLLIKHQGTAGVCPTEGCENAEGVVHLGGTAHGWPSGSL